MTENQDEVLLGPDSESDTPEGAVTFLHYWHAVLRHKIAIASIVAAFVTLGIIITLLMTPYFTSTARIEIDREQDKVTNVEAVSSGENAGMQLEFYQTQYALLESRSLAERVARTRNFTSKDRFFEIFGVEPDGGLLSGTGNAQSAAQRNRRLELATQILIDHVDIIPVKGSSLVDISFESPDAALSAEISNAWVDEFIAYNLDRRFNSTSDARKFLEEKLAELKQRLEDSERNLSGYADSKEIITLSTTQTNEGKTVSQKTLASTNLETLNNELARATADLIAAASEARQSSGDKNALNNSTLNILRGERATVQAEYAQLMTQFEPGYPAAKALESKIAALNKSIAAEERRSRIGTNARYREAAEREQKLRAQVNQLKNQFRSERRDSFQYNILQREVDTNRQLYDGLLQRYKEIGVAGVGTNNIALVDRAKPSDSPSSPLLLLNLALAIFVGLAVAGGYVLIVEQLDQTIKEPAEMKGKLGLASLGSIPNVSKEDILASLSDKKSVAWEAYLSITTSLTFLTDHGVPKSLLLTSTRPNEGKSTSALALATVLASSKKRILMVDGDMRNPSLHSMLGEKNIHGLSNYLAGDDDLDKLIHKSDVFGFDAMSAGPIPPNAAELLSGNRIIELIAKLGESYDTVIIDAPPVLGFADIPLLARSVEGVIYTIESGGAKLRDIQSSIQRIRNAHAHIFGGIITKVQQQPGYGYSYEYQYSYGSKTAEEV
ncbi:GumC family protein [Parasphingorhabdus sp.]|uniref:GumC family protein n=1 Tax=Parasphingorhabdus sp. TaxID=2709688 RepID=UPI003A91434C